MQDVCLSIESSCFGRISNVLMSFKCKRHGETFIAYDSQWIETETINTYSNHPPKINQVKSNRIKSKKHIFKSIKLHVRDISGTCFFIFPSKDWTCDQTNQRTPAAGLAAWLMATGLYWMDGKFWR